MKVEGWWGSKFGFAPGIFGFNGLKRVEKWLYLGSIWVRFGFIFLRNSIKTGKVWLRFSRKTFFKPRMGKNPGLENKFPGKREYGVGSKYPAIGNLRSLAASAVDMAVHR